MRPTLLKPASLLALCAILLLGGEAAHSEEDSANWSVKGFGTLGYAGTDTNALRFRRDKSEASGVDRGGAIDTDSRMGLQLDADLSDSLHVTTQWIARNMTGDFVEQNLEWAFVRWRILEGLNLRLGRMAEDAYLMSEYRNVGYTYPWMRPPHAFYASAIPNVFNGAELAQTFALGDGYLTLKGYGGYSGYSTQTSINTSAKIEMANFGGVVAYERSDWRARVSAWRGQFMNELDTAADSAGYLADPVLNLAWPGASSIVNSLTIKNKAIYYFSTGLAYDDGVWLGQTEGSYTLSENELTPSSVSGYVSVGRRFGKLTAYSVFGISKSVGGGGRNYVPRPLPQYDTLQVVWGDIKHALNQSVEEKSVSLGLRWDVYKNIDVKLEWDYFMLGGRISENDRWLQQPEGGPYPDTVNVWSVGVDFIF